MLLSRSFATQKQAWRLRAHLSGYSRRRALISSVADSRDYSPRKMVRKFGVRCSRQHCSITQLQCVDGPDSNISPGLSVPLQISCGSRHDRAANEAAPRLRISANLFLGAWSASQPGLGQTNDDVLFFCPNHVRELTASKNSSRCRLRPRSHARVGRPDRHARPMCRESLLSSRNFQELLNG